MSVCPDTGRAWMLDFPARTPGDPGQALLRQVQEEGPLSRP
jgi:hypothetical protein